ncbi:heterogeneous nuclear ribonucleoprotein U isoform X3 [Strongylocentrotus purpuratus]|uniref:Uncharacterized protein n=1 Tax=Strongylocentrotus purpuratus TaxID=7668 RepID=A0A7M7HGP1_STRPU|nr:heterogeneous nuclear ribonucleoprotein U isoform X3 [Strongylocentrotus purpuratus]
MSGIEPSKLKVAELRAELQARGLDSKGVKAVLVERLENALLDDAEEVGNEDEPTEAEGDDNFDDDVVELAQEALPEAEQGFGDEFGIGFSGDQEGTGQEADDDLLQEGEEGGDDQLLADLEIPPAMEEPEAEAAPQDVDEPQEEESMQQEVEAVPQVTEDAPQAVEEQGQDEQQPEGMEQAVEKEGENGEQTGDGDKKEEDKDKERKRDHENRNRDRRSGGRDRSPRRRTPPPVTMEEDDDIPDTQCVLSKYLSDLNLKIGKDGYNICPLSMEGFAYMWGGVKATHGVNKGKVAFECKLESQADVRHLPPEENNRHVVRVGWSIDASSLQLGEEDFSFGYGGTGKASVKCKFVDFGEKFGVGDVIGAYVDFEGEKPTISYTKNGTDLGVAFTIEEDLNGQALFPHFMVKNISVEVNFGQKEEPYFPLKEGFSFLGQLPAEDTERGPKPPATKKDCENVAVLVGFADEWSPCIIPVSHILEGASVQHTFVTVLWKGSLLRGKVLSVLRNAEDVKMLVQYLPCPVSLECKNKMTEDMFLSSDDSVSKTLKKLLEARLNNLYQTSFCSVKHTLKQNAPYQAFDTLNPRLSLPGYYQLQETNAANCHEPKEGCGVLESLIANIKMLNGRLSVALEHSNEVQDVCHDLTTMDKKLQVPKKKMKRLSPGSAAGIPRRKSAGKSMNRSPRPSFVSLDQSPDAPPQPKATTKPKAAQRKVHSSMIHSKSDEVKGGARGKPSKVVLRRSEVEKIYKSSTNYRVCALRLARKMFPGKKAGSRQSVPTECPRMLEVRHHIFELYNVPAAEQDTVWQECRQLLDQSFSFEDLQLDCLFPKCPKLVTSRGRIN